MYEKSHRIIQRNIKRGKGHEDRDKRNFEYYANGRIDVAEAKYRFKENNGMSYEDYADIPDEDFERWLNEIGWGRFWES